MNLELFIAKRILSKNEGNFSRPIVKIAIISIALGLATMIVSVAIVTGFQSEIRDKIIGFGSHIQISNYDLNSSFESTPIEKNQDFYPSIENTEGIRHIQVFANKAGIIKTDEQIEGVVLKGVGSDYDWSFFSDKIIDGKAFSAKDSKKTNDIIISKYLALKLKFKVGDKLRMFFIVDDKLRARAFTISGIYETGLEEFDKQYIIGDIAHIQRLNKWSKNQVAGFEILIDDINNLDKISQFVYEKIGYDLNSKNIKQLYPQLFDWLDLLDMNVYIILILMVIVSAINMISTLLILILEKTKMIGILKALGTKSFSIRKIFLYNSFYIIGKGLCWGNLIAIIICILQMQFGILKLNPASYYVSVVPINLNLLHIVLLNLGTLLACVIMLLVPSYIITRISPVKAIRFQ